jgi:hypothetical protein
VSRDQKKCQLSGIKKVDIVVVLATEIAVSSLFRLTNRGVKLRRNTTAEIAEGARTGARPPVPAMFDTSEEKGCLEGVLC